MSLLTGAVANNDPKPRCADCGQYVEDHKLGLNVHIRGLKQPEGGCAIAMKCEVCNRVEIAWSLWVTKPTDGGTLWVVQVPCRDHNYFALYPRHINRSPRSFHASGWHTLPEVPHGNI